MADHPDRQKLAALQPAVEDEIANQVDTYAILYGLDAAATLTQRIAAHYAERAKTARRPPAAKPIKATE